VIVPADYVHHQALAEAVVLLHITQTPAFGETAYPALLQPLGKQNVAFVHHKHPVPQAVVHVPVLLATTNPELQPVTMLETWLTIAVQPANKVAGAV
jgi:hypothetical protein